MMHASEMGQGDGFSGAACRASIGCVFFQSKMSATPVAMVLVFGKYGAQMELIPDNDVVQAFTQDGSNDTFRVSCADKHFEPLICLGTEGSLVEAEFHHVQVQANQTNQEGSARRRVRKA